LVATGRQADQAIASIEMLDVGDSLARVTVTSAKAEPGKRTLPGCAGAGPSRRTRTQAKLHHTVYSRTFFQIWAGLGGLRAVHHHYGMDTLTRRAAVD
jgi:hypothetical protein